MTEDWTVADSAGGLTLVSAPASSQRTVRDCMDRLTTADPAGVRVLIVSVTNTPDDLCKRWRTHAEAWPAELCYIVSNGVRRSAVASDRDAPIRTKHESTPITIKTVPPGNLTRLGVQITETLDGWADSDEPIVCCVDSLTALAQHVDDATLFRFVHALGDLLKSRDARAHFHVDPTAVDEQFVATVRTTVDAVEEPTATMDSGDPDGKT